jgi:cbb3-type cytochrome oxidase subunit 3
MFASNRFPLIIKKITGCELSFGWEITLALVVKFLLLGGLWWLFFAGQKHPVNEASMASKLFDEQSSSTFYQTNQERF